MLNLGTGGIGAIPINLSKNLIFSMHGSCEEVGETEGWFVDYCRLLQAVLLLA